MQRRRLVFGVIAVAAGTLAACEHSATTVPAKLPPVAAPRASVANGLPLGLTGNMGVGQYIICAVGADATFSWSSTAWGPTKIGNYSDTAKAGTATVQNGGSSAPTAWASGKCVAAYSYPQIDRHQFMLPLVTSTWQAQAGVQLDSIAQDSVKAQDLTVYTGPQETISSHPGASSLTGVVNNDYGQIVFYYFSSTPTLTLLKQPDAASVTAGNPIGFSMVVTNNGPGTAKAVTLADPLPGAAALSWSVASPASGCTIASGTLSCTLGDLAAGASATVHVTSPTTGAACTTYDNTATAQATGVATVQASASVTLVCPLPGIALVKTASPAVVAPFQPVTYGYTVTNTGNVTLTNITVVDDNGTPGNPADDIVVGTIASLAPGASQTLTRTMAPPVLSVSGALGGAGPSGFAVLSLGGDASHQSAGINCSNAVVIGNVGVPSYGTFNNMAPCSESGALYRGTNVKVTGPAVPAGGIITNESLLNQLRTDAFNAASYFAGLTPNRTVAGNQITNTMTLAGSVGFNVLNLTNLQLGSGETLTLGGPAGTEWVINIAGNFINDPGTITFAGGVTAADVVFNVTSPSATVRTHGGNKTAGILLAPYNAIRIDLGPFSGTVIGGYNQVITLISSTHITYPGTPPPTVTNTATATATAQGVSATSSATVTISK